MFCTFQLFSEIYRIELNCDVAVKFSNSQCNHSFICLAKAEECYFLQRCTRNVQKTMTALRCVM